VAGLRCQDQGWSWPETPQHAAAPRHPKAGCTAREARPYRPCGWTTPPHIGLLFQARLEPERCDLHWQTRTALSERSTLMTSAPTIGDRGAICAARSYRGCSRWSSTS